MRSYRTAWNTENGKQVFATMVSSMRSYPSETRLEWRSEQRSLRRFWENTVMWQTRPEFSRAQHHETFLYHDPRNPVDRYGSGAVLLQIEQKKIQ